MGILRILIYNNGQGGPQDYVKAREWFKKAADEGDAGAKDYLEKLPIAEAAKAGRYADALQLQKAWAVKVEVREREPGKETAQDRTPLDDGFYKRQLASVFSTTERLPANGPH